MQTTETSPSKRARLQRSVSAATKRVLVHPKVPALIRRVSSHTHLRVHLHLPFRHSEHEADHGSYDDLKPLPALPSRDDPTLVLTADDHAALNHDLLDASSTRSIAPTSIRSSLSDDSSAPVAADARAFDHWSWPDDDEDEGEVGMPPLPPIEETETPLHELDDPADVSNPDATTSSARAAPEDILPELSDGSSSDGAPSIFEADDFLPLTPPADTDTPGSPTCNPEDVFFDQEKPASHLRSADETGFDAPFVGDIASSDLVQNSLPSIPRNNEENEERPEAEKEQSRPSSPRPVSEHTERLVDPPLPPLPPSPELPSSSPHITSDGADLSPPPLAQPEEPVASDEADDDDDDDILLGPSHHTALAASKMAFFPDAPFRPLTWWLRTPTTGPVTLTSFLSFLFRTTYH
ncbi:hypothetical protein PUNSTDRAFT_46363 [Punctularia strigosozonata HHB-11173 SS5]|uniref:uncharacterized protein n=1 Tax=Punctularia strigosozonata (strain HHB-11173) TaxID=741275 RepID=UPI0004417723|nr:uncharacterized protein PUNSTDRAFT_46363 [Punctularia strigosozonata HHB-11173 SS5]EIN06109.1 hypothetical protein PUNSTDRAFT_46363 [Punctularia strigosozonata HHB-11173 SS5]